jgi:RNA polymerase sigma-70 factor (ECF subfamily)
MDGIMDLAPYRELDPQAFRTYLTFLAGLNIDPRLRGKIDLSGVVQETLLEAHQALARLRVASPGQRLAWLRRVLANNLTDVIRRARAGVRDVTRECSLDEALEQSSARLEEWLATDHAPPDARLIRDEQQARLADALARLPADQRTAVELHHLRGLPVADVSRHMGRSGGATGALIARGLKRLRELLDDPRGAPQ